MFVSFKNFIKKVTLLFYNVTFFESVSSLIYGVVDSSSKAFKSSLFVIFQQLPELHLQKPCSCVGMIAFSFSAYCICTNA